MMKAELISKSQGATVQAPNKPTEGNGQRAMLQPFPSVEYIDSCV